MSDKLTIVEAFGAAAASATDKAAQHCGDCFVRGMKLGAAFALEYAAGRPDVTAYGKTARAVKPDTLRAWAAQVREIDVAANIAEYE